MHLQARDFAEAARAMLDGEDFDLVVADAVDHAVALNEYFTDIVELVLGHDTPTAWGERQAIRRLKNLLGKADGLPR
jgi:hypothetical protein